MIIHCDGLAQPNPGKATWAFVAFTDEGLLQTVVERHGPAGDVETNNIAEYMAVIKALEWIICSRQTTRPITIATDSRLVVEQVNGRWKCKHPRLQIYRDRAQSYMRDAAEISLVWMPREQNEADAFTRIALEEITGVYPEE